MTKMKKIPLRILAVDAGVNACGIALRTKMGTKIIDAPMIERPTTNWGYYRPEIDMTRTAKMICRLRPTHIAIEWQRSARTTDRWRRILDLAGFEPSQVFEITGQWFKTHHDLRSDDPDRHIKEISVARARETCPEFREWARDKTDRNVVDLSHTAEACILAQVRWDQLTRPPVAEIDDLDGTAIRLVRYRSGMCGADFYRACGGPGESRNAAAVRQSHLEKGHEEVPIRLAERIVEIDQELWTKFQA